MLSRHRAPFPPLASGLLFLTVLALLGTPRPQAATFSEDFTTTDYRDPANTTADWDTLAGELRLFPFATGQLGSYNTPGEARGVAISGDVAFVADQTGGLQVVDISDPSNLTLLASLAVPGFALGIAVDGDYAFITASSSGLQVVDISDPANPQLVGSLLTPGFASEVVVSGNHAYVADYSGDLQVVDVSNPALPFLAGTYSTPGNVDGIAVDGDLAFLADENFGLSIVDVADPTNPTFVGFLDTAGSARGISVDGDLAFLADGGNGLLVIDIRVPAAPVVIGSYNTPGLAYGVVAEGNLVLVADGTSGVQLIDITASGIPVPVGSYDTGEARQVVLAGGQAFVADGTSGLRVVRLFADAIPTLTSSTLTPGQSRRVALAGDRAFLADGLGGLQVVDISDISNPILTGSYDTPDATLGALDVAVTGNHAFVADGESGLLIVDISDPDNPVLTGSYDTPGSAHGIALAGNHAFVADLTGGLQIIDISDPTTPTFAGSVAIPSARDIHVAHNLAVVVGSTFETVDISDPSNPVVLGNGLPLAFFAEAVEVSGDHAYVANGPSGLQVMDISDPSNPLDAGFNALSDFAHDVHVSGDRLYVADDLAGLQTIDISDPSNPTPLERVSLGAAQGVAIAGEFAFVADRFVGLVAYRVLQDEVDGVRATGQSLEIDGEDATIVRARITSNETAGVAWELSGNGGVVFQPFTPGADWVEFDTSLTDLIWRSSHTWSPGLNPTVSDVTVEWLIPSARITAVVDVPNDQGKQVLVEWLRSGFDFVGDPTQIVEYAVYRRVDGELPRKATAPDLSSHSLQVQQHAEAMLAAGWTFLTTAPVRVEDYYSVVVPTLADSTIASGQHRTTFMVSALTATPGVFFDSPPDSGYSLDNLEPSVPTNLVAAYQADFVDLDWDDATDGDVQFFRVYRDGDPSFVPSPQNLAQEVAASDWRDPTANAFDLHYKVSAVDFSGNEGPAASPAQATGVSPPPLERRLVLHGATPNPFNPRTTLSFSLPATAPAQLSIHDLRGRRVVTLLDGPLAAGKHQVSWDGRDANGRNVTSGVYVARLQSGGEIRSVRVALSK